LLHRVALVQLFRLIARHRPPEQAVMALRPMNMFCCGCPLTFGVKFILLVNLIVNLFYIVTVTLNIIFQIPTVVSSLGPTAEIFNGAWCLLGLPFIVIGYWGVSSRAEGHLRLYLQYLCCGFIVDMVFLSINFVFRDVCAQMPHLLRHHGSAFACGAMRIGSLLVVIQVVVLELYFIFAVWSCCEDFKAGGGGVGLPELLRHHQNAHKKQHHDHIYSDQLFGAAIAPGYPKDYGAFNRMQQNQPQLGPCKPIGQGYFHETSYPPPQSFS